MELRIQDGGNDHVVPGFRRTMTDGVGSGGGKLQAKFMAKKLTTAQVAAWRRQLPDAAPQWQGVYFVFDPDCRDYDWLVVYDDLSPIGNERFSTRTEPLACPPEHTVLVTAEPSSIKCYSTGFCAQFALVISHHQPWALRHPSVIRTQTGYPWFYGRGEEGVRGFDSIVDHPPTAKSRELSTVCSARKDRKTLQGARLAFTRALKQAMPSLDWYGKGINPLPDKALALDDYRYTVAVENDRAPDYFTEKLTDAFLGMTLPFYFGCTNTQDYFPPESFVPIDIFDTEGSVETIRRALAEGVHASRMDALAEARRRVLYEHNLFALLSREIRAHHTTDGRPQPGRRILSRRAHRNSGPGAFLKATHEKFRLRREVDRRRDARTGLVQ